MLAELIQSFGAQETLELHSQVLRPLLVILLLLLVGGRPSAYAVGHGVLAASDALWLRLRGICLEGLGRWVYICLMYAKMSSMCRRCLVSSMMALPTFVEKD